MRIVINSRKPAAAAASPPAAIGLLPTLNPQPSTLNPPAGRHTAIAPANLQAVLDSAANAVHKGHAAWWTLWKAFHNVKYAKVEVMQRLD